jgi:hypothetical protein
MMEHVIPLSAFDGDVHRMNVKPQNGLGEARLSQQGRAFTQRRGPRLRVRRGAGQHREYCGAGIPKSGLLCDPQRHVNLACGIVARTRS